MTLSDFPPSTLSTRYFIQHLLRSLPFLRSLRHGTTHEANIAFLGLLTGVAPLPLTLIQARAAPTLSGDLDEESENSKMDWTQESTSMDILTRYES